VRGRERWTVGSRTKIGTIVGGEEVVSPLVVVVVEAVVNPPWSATRRSADPVSHTRRGGGVAAAFGVEGGLASSSVVVDADSRNTDDDDDDDDDEDCGGDNGTVGGRTKPRDRVGTIGTRRSRMMDMAGARNVAVDGRWCVRGDGRRVGYMGRTVDGAATVGME